MKIKLTPKGEVVQALYMLKNGLANVEQQKLVFQEWHKKPAELPVKTITKDEIRAVTVHLMLNYSNDVGEKLSHNQAYGEVAAAHNVSPVTVRRAYERFLKQDEAHKNRKITAFKNQILQFWSEYIQEDTPPAQS